MGFDLIFRSFRSLSRWHLIPVTTTGRQWHLPDQLTGKLGTVAYLAFLVPKYIAQARIFQVDLACDHTIFQTDI